MYIYTYIYRPRNPCPDTDPICLPFPGTICLPFPGTKRVLVPIAAFVLFLSCRRVARRRRARRVS